jgi:hypothetical protein
MVRWARIYAAICLAVCAVLALVYFARTGTTLWVRAGAVLYCVALAVILLGLFRQGGRDLSRIALVLSVVWGLWGFVDLAVFYFARPPGFTAVMAFASAFFGFLVPGTLCALALKRLQREGPVPAGPAQSARHA